MIFVYRAIDDQGQLCQGLKEGPSKSSVREGIEQEHLSILSLRRSALSWSLAQKLLFWEGLVQLTEAGYKIHESLALLSEALPSRTLKMLTKGLHDHILRGESLPDACAHYQDFFDPLDRQLIGVSHHSGHFLPVFQDVLRRIQYDKNQRQQLLSALTYPLLVLVLLGGVGGFYEFYLLPEMDHLKRIVPSANDGTTSPDIQSFTGYAFWLVAVAFLGLPWIKGVRDRLLGQLCPLIPSLGRFLAPHTLRFWFKSMALMTRHGVPLLTALKVSRSFLPLSQVEKAFLQLEQKVEEGHSLSSAFAQGIAFAPESYISQLQMAEKTGSYGPAFLYLGDLTEKTVQRRQEHWLRLLGPFSMLVVGGLMVLLIFRCLGPLYEMIQGVL